MLATWGTSTGRNPTLDLQFAGATSLDNRITFSRGSQATLFDSTGALVYAKHNLLLQSQTFQTTWTVAQASVSADATTAPDGTTTADTLVENTANAEHYARQNTTQSAGSRIAFSVFVKAAGRTSIRLRVLDNAAPSNGFFGSVDTSTGATASGVAGTGTITSVTASALPNGWYRLVVVGIASATATTVINDIFILPTDQNSASNYTGNGTSGVFLWGAQVNLDAMEGGVTSSLSTYYPTVASAYYAPRFDYNPSTLAAQGLLIEEQRTNPIRNNTMQGAVAGTPGTLPTNWTNNITAGLTQEIVGTGTENGITYIDWRLSGTATGTSQIAFESTTQITAAASQAWTATSYARLVAGSLTNVSSLQMCIREGTAAGGFVRDETANFTPTSAALRTQRASVAIASTNALTERVMPRIFANTVGAVDFTLRIGLPQMEQGAFATSVIPTTTTALTRSADVASVNTLSPWYNATAGTLYAEAVTFSTTNTAALVSIDDTTVNNRMVLRRSLTGPQSGFRMVSSGGSIDATLVSGTVSGVNKLAFAATASDQSAASNGALFTGIVSITPMPTVTRLALGDSPASTVLNGWLRRISYYPVRLPNSTLQALTA